MVSTSRKARSRRPDNNTTPQQDPSKPPVTLTLAQVEHGLNYPDFDPNAYFAPDLFTDSSPLPGRADSLDKRNQSR